MIKNFQYSFKTAYRSSRLFCNINRLRYPKRAVNERTHITIDGFQRSANTYAYYYFKELNKESKIAHHSHSFRQIIYSVEKNIPTILLIREPSDVILSSYLYHFEKVDIKLLAESWINYYEKIINYKSNLVVSHFDQTTSNFSRIISGTNSKFKTNFNSFSNKNFEERIKVKISRRKISNNRQSMPSKLRSEVRNNALSKISCIISSYENDFNKVYDKFR